MPAQRSTIRPAYGTTRMNSSSLALLLDRERRGESGWTEVVLAEAAADFALPLKHGLTPPTGVLGGALPGYFLYQTKRGWIALAALEPHSWQRLEQELAPQGATRAALAQIFATRTAEEWAVWASERDLPLAAVREGGS